MKIDINKLEIAMAKKCLTCYELADSAKLSRLTLQKIINSKVIARPATVGKIARALNVDVEELIENTAATVNQKNDGVL